MAEPTTRDALIAEMLGDIGRLHDSVEALKTVLPGQIGEVETKITGLIGLLQRAGDAYREQIETYTTAVASQVKDQMEKDALAAKVRFDRDSHDAIRAALAEVERTVKNTVQSEITAPVQSALRIAKQGVWRTITLCLASGVLGGAVVFTANAVIIGNEDPYYAEYGRAVAAVWNKLDSRAKTLIEEQKKK